MARRLPKRVKARVGNSPAHSFRSSGELSLAESLEAQGIPWSYESEKFEYQLIHTYLPDFKITTQSGKVIHLEFKGWTPGWESGSDRTKLLAVRETYPLLDLRLVWATPAFARRPIRRGGKTTNEQWAEKHGFASCSVGVPLPWLQE
jgi:hypothetical protein